MSEKSFFLLLTQKCNLKCPHCYNALDPDKNKITESAQLSIDRITVLFEKLKEQGYKKVLFSGGEALLHPDVIHIIKLAHEIGFITALFTNGCTFSKNIIEDLNKAGLNEIRISFNDLVWVRSREQYESIFSKQTEWLPLLKSTKIKVGYIYIISKINYDYIMETYLRLHHLNVSMKVQPLYLPEDEEKYKLNSAANISITKWENLISLFLNQMLSETIADNSEDNNTVYGTAKDIADYLKRIVKYYDQKNKPSFCPTGPLLVVDAEGYFHPCVFRHDISFGNIANITDIVNVSESLSSYNYFENAECFREECLSAFR